MFTKANTERRLDRVYRLQRADQRRFEPNPLGPGYLTRNQRWNEIVWRLQARLKRAA